MFPTKTHILLIEDTNWTRILISKYLRLLEFTNISEVANCTDGKKILEASLEANPVGLLITDIRMPNITGLEFVKSLRSDPRFEKLPVIFLSGSWDPSMIQVSISLGVSEFIVKPATPAVVLKKLQNAWENLKQTNVNKLRARS